MPIKNISWEGPDTDRKPSASIWGRCPFEQIRAGTVNGYVFEDNFTSMNITPPTTEGNWGASGGDYALFTSSGATVTPALAVSNVAQGGIVFASANNNDAIGLRTVSIPFALAQNKSKLWFEARILKSTVANTQFDVFCGFYANAAMTANVPFSAAATLADNNLFGFWSKSTAGGNCAVSYKSSGVAAADISTTDAVMVANTYTKLGLKYEFSGDAFGTYALSFYQDGTRLATAFQVPSTAGTFPINAPMGLCFAIRNAVGSSPGTVNLQWWRAAQLVTPYN